MKHLILHSARFNVSKLTLPLNLSGLRQSVIRRLALAVGMIPLSAVQILFADEPGIPSYSPEKPILLSSVLIEASSVSPRTDVTSDTALLLENTPGLSFYSAGGVSSLPVIHGLADDRLRVQVDGMDLISACANHMNPPLSYIAPSSVGNITVYPYIVPVSIGGDSIGGTILVNSTTPDFATNSEPLLLRASAGAFYRTNSNAQGAHLSSSVGTAKFALSYNASLTKADDYEAAHVFKSSATIAGTTNGKTDIDGKTVGSTAFESVNHALHAAVRETDQLVELGLGYQIIPYQGFPNQRMDMTRNKSEHLTLRYTLDKDALRLETKAYYEHTRHKMNFAADKVYWYGSASTILAPGMPMDTEGKNLGVSTKVVVPVAVRDDLGFGLEAQRYRLDDWWPPSPSVLPPGYTTGGMAPDTFRNINGGKRDRYATYAEWTSRWSDKFKTIAGIRHETVQSDTGPVQGYNSGMMYNGAPLFPATRFNQAEHGRTDRNWDLSAQASYDRTQNLSYEFGYSRKTRSPNLYERYAWSTNMMAMEMVNLVGDGNFYVGNLDLKPEVAHTLSATFDSHDTARKKWGFSVSPNFTYVVDYIDTRRLPTEVGGSTVAILENQTLTKNFVYLQYANKTAELYGFDVNGHFPLVDSSALGSLHGTFAVSYVRGRNLTNNDNLYNIVPLNSKLSVVQRIGEWSNTIENQWYAAKTKVSSVRNEFSTGGYTLINLRSNYTWGRFRAEVGVENLFDKFYYQPLGGAYTGQGSTMAGRTIPWGVGVPGPARTYYVSLNVNL